MGIIDFPEGIYAYVGSAQMGIEPRVERHRKRAKKLYWHIDHLLKEATVICTVSLPIPGKVHECAVAMSLLDMAEASLVAQGFGSSDCRCPSHLIYFGDVDAESAVESITWKATMLDSVYSRTI